MAVTSVGNIRGFVQSHQAKQFDYMLNPLQTERRNWQQYRDIHKGGTRPADDSADTASSPGFPERAHAEPQHPAHQAAGAALSPFGVREHLDNMPVHPGYDPTAPNSRSMAAAAQAAKRFM
jgi:hypothetical protein